MSRLAMRTLTLAWVVLTISVAVHPLWYIRP